jgi:hypothetical protein
MDDDSLPPIFLVATPSKSEKTYMDRKMDEALPVGFEADPTNANIAFKCGNCLSKESSVPDKPNMVCGTSMDEELNLHFFFVGCRICKGRWLANNLVSDQTSKIAEKRSNGSELCPKVEKRRRVDLKKLDLTIEKLKAVKKVNVYATRFF